MFLNDKDALLLNMVLWSNLNNARQGADIPCISPLTSVKMYANGLNYLSSINVPINVIP